MNATYTIARKTAVLKSLFGRSPEKIPKTCPDHKISKSRDKYEEKPTSPTDIGQKSGDPAQDAYECLVY